ncbi:hypothetical protein P4O66_009309 [Electrophorus voltai]|uniref:Uncharacterized protein n=1 Tax=Electrophorus voltai TaxID=2609070 RepID=A0AAD9DYQ6_9TELE|nr:hypothetical protein P4O66_009309 [Electrophorus voltai]
MTALSRAIPFNSPPYSNLHLFGARPNMLWQSPHDRPRVPYAAADVYCNHDPHHLVQSQQAEREKPISDTQGLNTRL